MVRFAGFLALALCAGCSSDSSNGGSGGGGGGSCKALSDLCSRLSTTDVESACGSGYDVLTPVDTSGAGPVNSCTWAKDVSTATEYNVSVVYRCLEGVDAHQYYESSIQPILGQGEDVTGLGDEAYYHAQGSTGEALIVRQGQVVVEVHFSHPDPATCTADQAKAQAIAVAQKTIDLAK